MWAYVLWLLFVLVGLLGWGRIATSLFRIDRRKCRSATDLVLGIGLTSCLGAVIALTSWGSPTAWTLLVGFGAAFWVGSAAIEVTHQKCDTRRWRTWVASAAAFCTTLWISMAFAATRPWNPCDDDPSYLYLARRFWQLGDIHEPFSNRRLTSPGLFTFVQSIVMGPFAEGALQFADETLGAILVLLVLWRRTNEETLYVSGVVVSAAVLFSHQYLGSGNSSPTFFIFAVLLAGIPSLTDAVRGGRDSFAEGVCFGVSGAVVVLSRPYLLLVWLILAGALVGRGRRVLNRWFLFGTTTSGLVVATPWLILGMLDVNTPLFPLFKGNLAANFPFDGYLNFVSIADSLRDSLQGLGNSHWPLAIALLLISYAMVNEVDMEFSRHSRRNYRFVLLMAGGLVVFYLLFAVSVRRTGPAVWFPRFWAPSLAVPVVLLVLQLRDVPHRVKKIPAVASVIAPLVLFLPTPNGVWATTSTSVRITTSGLLTSLVSDRRYAEFEQAYLTLASRIPDGSRVLLAVQLPHLLLSERYEVMSLDLPVSTVRGEGFPFFTDNQQRRHWIVDNGFDYAVVTRADSSSCLFGLSSWKSNIGKNNTYSDWMPYAMDWITFTESLSRDRTLVVAQSLDVVLLRLIPDQL